MMAHEPEHRGARHRRENARAGGVVTVAGVTGAVQVVGLVADVGQLTSMTAVVAVVAVNLVIALAGLYLLSDATYRRSRPRVAVTAGVVVVSGVLAGFVLVDRRTGVTATVRCAPSCETSEDSIELYGVVTGALGEGDQLRLFVRAPDGRHYAGATATRDGDDWRGRVRLGSANGTEATYSYEGCLYRIDRVFADHLSSLGDAMVNKGLTDMSTVGDADRLACETLVWRRP